MNRVTKLTLLASTMALLASCGLRGDLKRPAEPMFGGAKSASDATADATANGNEGLDDESIILKQEEEQDDYSDELLGGPEDDE